MTEAVGQSRDELEAQIIARAWSDERFRERLKADPQSPDGFFIKA